jgi:hypothetical protein
MLKIWGLKMTKIDPKMTPYKFHQNWPKIDFHGGGQNVQNRSKLTGGVRGGKIINFLKFLHFLQKLPPFLTPKIDPIKMLFPTNRLYFLSKRVIYGRPGGGPLGPKNVDTTI